VKASRPSSSRPFVRRTKPVADPLPPTPISLSATVGAATTTSVAATANLFGGEPIEATRLLLNLDLQRLLK